MRVLLIILALVLIALPNPSHAQFIGIGLRIPNASQDGVGNGVVIGGGGSVIPNNAMTFNGAYMTFNGAYMTFSGTP